MKVNKRVWSVLLASAMTAANMGGDLSAVYADSGEEITFDVYGTELVEAISQAVEDGEAVTREDLNFTNGRIGEYEELFFENGPVYEVMPEEDGESQFYSGMDAELRVFVRVPEGVDEITDMTGDEELIFLYINNTDETIHFSANVLRQTRKGEKGKTAGKARVLSYEEAYGEEEADLTSRDQEESLPTASPSEARPDTEDENATASEAKKSETVTASRSNAGKRNMVGMDYCSAAKAVTTSLNKLKVELETGELTAEIQGTEGLEVRLSAAPDAIPAGAAVRAQAVDDVAQAVSLLSMEDEAAELEELPEGIVIADIRLVDADGNEISPEGEIELTVSDASGNASQLQVYSLDGGKAGIGECVIVDGKHWEDRHFTMSVGETIRMEAKNVFPCGNWEIVGKDQDSVRFSNPSYHDGKASVEVEVLKAVDHPIVIRYYHFWDLLYRSFTIDVKANEAGSEAYFYILKPGTLGDVDDQPDTKWYRATKTGILSKELQNPEQYEGGKKWEINGNVHKYPGADAYPEIEDSGIEYTYDSEGTGKTGTYSIEWKEIVVADGANIGINGAEDQLPEVPEGTNTFHVNGYAVLHSASKHTIRLMVQDAGSEEMTSYGLPVMVKDQTSEMELNIPVLPSKEAGGIQYRFDGWYTDSGCTVKADFKGTITSDKTYYGRYIPEARYTVSFTAGAEAVTNMPENIQAAEGDRVDLSALQIPVREGYTFRGWTTEAEVEMTDNAFVMPGYDVAFTAQWEKHENGGSGNIPGGGGEGGNTPGGDEGGNTPGGEGGSTSSGGSQGGGSGSSGSTIGQGSYTQAAGGPGETAVIDPEAVPLAQLPGSAAGENDPAAAVIRDGEVPLAGLPKTGQSSKTSLVTMFSGIFLALTVFGKRRKEEK